MGWGEGHALAGVSVLCEGDCGGVIVSVMISTVSSMVSGLFVVGCILMIRLLEYGGGGFGMMLYEGNTVRIWNRICPEAILYDLGERCTRSGLSLRNCGNLMTILQGNFFVRFLR